MSAIVADTTKHAKSYLTDGTTIRSWLLTTDHKRIALLYLGSITLFFFIGGIAAALIRYNLIAPQGMISSAETYNRLFTMHGVVMVWFFLIPAVPVTLGNFLVPLMLGARDLAFPEIESDQLVSLYSRRSSRSLFIDRGGRRHRLDLLYPANHRLLKRTRGRDDRRDLYRRLFVDRHRTELHHIDPYPARARDDLVQDASVSVVPIRDKRHLGACDPGAGDDTCCCWRSSGYFTSAYSTRRSAATRYCSNIYFGSTHTRRFM